MTPTSDDDRFDELLAQAARGYNEPGDVPREAMWARIADARREARAGAAPTQPVGAPVRDRTRGRGLWFWPGIGVAAALVLSTGIVIGRHVERGAAAGGATSGAPVAANPAADTGRAGPRASATTVADARPANASPVDSITSQLREETRKTDAHVRELAATAPASSDRGGVRDNLAYQLVVMRHFAGAEAMITSFRSSAARGEQDAAMASWARELLGTTRTLEASPAATDPVMKRLLDDLDLVITQIVQYTSRGTYNPDDLDLIEQSIRKRGVMSKLRSTLPARPMPAGL